MKKAVLVSMSVIILSVLLISEISHAQGKADRGPLTKKVFIHYKSPKAKPAHPAKPPKTDEGSYTYLASGMKWKTPEDFVVNDSPTVAALIGQGMDTWEDAAGTTIFGDVSSDKKVEFLLDDIDNINAIYFAPLEESNIIAVTYVWGYYNAPPKFREIVEVDMVFNTNFVWGDAIVNPNVMDILNIATHELGHAAGMGDLYNTTASQETMYGYSSEGEISKRDLYIGDITGISKLY